MVQPRMPLELLGSRRNSRELRRKSLLQRSGSLRITRVTTGHELCIAGPSAWERQQG